jgi:hypothetical protein
MSSGQELQAKNDDESLESHQRSSTFVPSISDPIFKQQANSNPPMFQQSLEESLQDCIIDQQGRYLNRGGTCIEDCYEGQTLIIYDWDEGYCCCAYLDTKNHKQESHNCNVQSSASSSKFIENCTKDENGDFVNVEGSCKGDCEFGRIGIVYDSVGGYCCCSDEVQSV